MKSGILNLLHRPGWRRVGNGLMIALSLFFILPPAAIAQLADDAARAKALAQSRARPLAVDLETGKLELVRLDAMLFRGITVTGLGRFWSAGAPDHGLGPGWRLTCDEQVTLNPDGSATILGVDGVEQFDLVKPSEWASREGVRSSLTRTADKSFLWIRPDLEQRQYNAAGWLLRLAGPSDGFQVERNAANLATRLLDRSGNALEIGTTGEHYSAVRDPMGSEWRYQFKGGRLAAVERPAGGRERYEYDAAGRLALADVGFGAIEIQRDAAGRVTGQQAAGLLLGRWTYATPDGGWEASEESPIGAPLLTGTRSADARNRACTAADGRRMTMTYDKRGQLLRVEEGGQAIFTAETDADGRYLSLRDGNADIAISYDDRGLPTHLTGLGNVELLQEFDDAGRLLRLRRSDGGRLELLWNATGQCTTMTVQEPLLTPQTAEFAYAANGQLQAMRCGEKALTCETDALGRISKLTDATGTVVELVYDAESQPVQVRENGTERLAVTYDARSLPTTLKARGGTVSFRTQLDGRLAAITGADGGVTGLKYDSFNRLASVTNPGGGEFTFGYDAQGRAASATIPGGAGVRYLYDQANRPLKVLLPEGEITWAYDDDGRLVKQDGGPLGTVQYQYAGTGSDAIGWSDSNGEQVERDDTGVTYRQASVPCAVTTSIAKDGDEIVQTVKLQTEELFRRTFSSAGRLTLVDGAAGTFQFQYDQAGRRSSLTYPNGVRATYGYEPRSGELQKLVIRAADGALLDQRLYTYDDAGRVASIQLADDARRHYRYDQAGRLTEVTDATGAVLEKYGWDANGNLTSRLANGEAAPISLDPQGRVTAVGERAVLHDAQGRRTQDGTTVFTYDALSRLRRISGPDTAAEFGYSLNGNRLWRQNGQEQKRHYLYSGADVVAETDPQGKIQSSVVLGSEPDEILAERGADGAWRYHHRDPLQSLLSVTGRDGKKQAQYQYSAFGLPLTGDPAVGHQRLFAGRDWLGIANLYDNRARAYDPVTARFLTPDPAGLTGGLNPFGYCGGDPVAYRDPSGKVIPILVFVAVGALAGGGGETISQWCGGKGFNGWKIGFATVIGGATGALGGAYQAVKWAGVAIAAGGGFVKQLGDDYLWGDGASLGDAVLSAVIGGLTAGLCDKLVNPRLMRVAYRTFWQSVKQNFGKQALKNTLVVVGGLVGGAIDTVVGLIKDKINNSGLPGSIGRFIRGIRNIFPSPFDPVGGLPNGLPVPSVIPLTWIRHLLDDGLGGGFFGGGALPGPGGRPGGKSSGPVKLDNFR